MYEQMLAEVRSVNAGLADALRIRVLLGDPPIDWSAVTSPADEDMNDWRDAHFASVIDREVVRRRERALILIGGAHISRKVVFPNSLIHLLDSRFPGQTWVVGILDFGREIPTSESGFEGWTLPAGVAVRDTWLGKLNVEQIGFTLSMGVVGGGGVARGEGAGGRCVGEGGRGGGGVCGGGEGGWGEGGWR